MEMIRLLGEMNEMLGLEDFSSLAETKKMKFKTSAEISEDPWNGPKKN